MSRVSEWQVINRGSTPALSIRTTTTMKQLQAAMDEAREKLTAYLEHIDEYSAGSFYVTYHSFSKQGVVLEAGFPLLRKLEGQQEIKPAEKRAGLFLTCYHQGPYRLIPRVYREMDEWLDIRHFQTDGTSEEIYLNHDVPEEQLITQILMPIQPNNEGEEKLLGQTESG